MLTPAQYACCATTAPSGPSAARSTARSGPAPSPAPAAARTCSPRRPSSTAAPAGPASPHRSTGAVGTQRRPQLLHAAHRGPLQPLRRPPRPRVRGRPAADRAALLHERRGDDLHPGDGSGVVTRLRLAALLAGWPSRRRGAGAARRGTAVATFASGCFWCTESDFEKVPGVVEAVSGYIGGAGRPDLPGGLGRRHRPHRGGPAPLRPGVVTYEQLLDVYWRNVDFLTPAASSATAATSTARRSSSTTRRSAGGARIPRRSSSSRAASTARSSRRSSTPARSIRPRTTTRITTRRTRSAIRSTATTAAGTRAWRSWAGPS